MGITLMSIVNNLRIRSRLLIAVLVPVILTALTITWFTMHQLREDGDANIEMLRQNLLEARKTGLQNVIETTRSVIQEAMDDPALSEEEAKEEARSRIRAITFAESNYVFAYQRDLFNLAYRPDPSREGPTTNPDVRKLIGNIFKAAENDGFHSYQWPNPATGNVEQKVSYATVIPEWDWMIGAGVYTTDIQHALAAAEQKIQAHIADTILFFAIITAIVIIAALAIGLLVGRSVTAPLNRVSHIMHEIAEGEGDLRQRLPAEGNDELSELGRRFNSFIVKIQNTIQQVGSTTDQLASAAEELSRVAVETRASVHAQGSETDQIASAINEMAATIQQISGNATEVESAASDADRIARDGGATITHAQAAVNQLSEEIEDTATSISALAQKSDDIQQVLDVIHAVTEQTNLLALNAAIEAARAGEHGRGFSVVADEVRQLAHRSAESAEQIRGMIDGFVSESKAAVDRMKASQNRSSETVERIDHATTALRTIESSVTHIHDQVTQIATASEEQSQVAEEVNRNIVRIVEAAQRSDEGVTQTNDASQELARLGESLRDLVGQFKV